VKPRFFATPDKLRAWLERHHETAQELFVGYYRKGSGKPSISWSDSVDEALCFGWIDGVRRSIDDESYAIRFTPRKSRSTWSAVNVRKVGELTRQGRMTPAGLAALEARSEARTGIYSHEQAETPELDPDQERRFRADKKAWAFFQAQPPSYRKTAIWLVVSAKKPETREKRLATLIEDSAAGRRLRQLTRRTGAHRSEPS
jgi:uncharacterized protein YdeI (YjbR/CyaY-like superfamily)